MIAMVLAKFAEKYWKSREEGLNAHPECGG
jgi:hypothetical protein